MSRLGGGIGTRGPGESKLETDRRLIHQRIGQLKSELEQVKRTEKLQEKEEMIRIYQLLQLWDIQMLENQAC